MAVLDFLSFRQKRREHTQEMEFHVYVSAMKLQAFSYQNMRLQLVSERT